MSSGSSAGGTRDPRGVATSYPDQVARELAARGIGGALRRRIVVEIEDHLACDPAAELGDPATLARQFADELGTRRARRAAFSAFAALATTGTLLVVAVIAVRSAGGLAVRIHQGGSALGTLGLVLTAVGAQVALVAGALGCLRALRRREVAILSREEALILVRRAAVGLVGGLVAMAGLALSAIAFKGSLPSWWSTLALSIAGAGALALAAAVPAVLVARSLPPHLEGAAGDLAEDLLGLVPARLDAGSRRFAVGVACAVALLITLAGVLQDDPFDGLLRGLADGAACLAGYLALGSYLGLSSSPARTQRPR